MPFSSQPASLRARLREARTAPLLNAIPVVVVGAQVAYHAIMARQIRRIFTDLNRGEYEFALSVMAKHFEHRFAGDGALGGTRHSTTAFRLWLQRLMRLTNGRLDVHVHHLAISGWPWNATAVAEWTDDATLADGLPYSNRGAHIIRLRWFRATSIHAMLDTVVWQEARERLISNGITEAAAAPIED